MSSNKPRSMMSLLNRALLLIVVSCAVAVTGNALSPHQIAWTGNDAFSLEAAAAKSDIHLVDLDEVRSIIDGILVVVLDARSTELFVEGHMPGALSMPVDQASEVFADWQVLLAPEQPVLVYCGGRTCDDSLRLGQFLREQGVEDVRLFPGGFEAWLAAGMEVESGL